MPTSNNQNSIITFKSNFYGGTRANRFIVNPVWPKGNETNNFPADGLEFRIVSASLPSAQINTISVPYRGRVLNFAGERIYSTWNIGIYDDTNDKHLWKSLHSWAEAMDGHKTHQVVGDDFNYSDLQTNWIIHQYGLNNTILRTITLVKCWPSVVGEINLNMSETGYVAFSATLTFDYFTVQTDTLGAGES
jgi:hypothetical protein